MVAPLVGAWIEIVSLAIVALIITVAPLVGAWIEMPIAFIALLKSSVAPLVGAWIEILSDHPPPPRPGRSSRGSVD